MRVSPLGHLLKYINNPSINLSINLSSSIPQLLSFFYPIQFCTMNRRFPQPFALLNGIRLEERLALLRKIAPSHEAAKAQLQKKYFGEADTATPVFAFVGRIVLQKGVSTKYVMKIYYLMSEISCLPRVLYVIYYIIGTFDSECR